jgi:hypothetical protein
MTKASHFFLLCSLLSAPILGSSNAHAATFVTIPGGACLTDQFGNTANRNPVVALQCFGIFSQQWQWEGLFIKGIGTSDGVQKCVDVVGGGIADGTPVQLFQCNGTVSQQWRFVNGEIINRGKCLDVGDGANGTQATIQKCNFNVSPGQFWAIRS